MVTNAKKPHPRKKRVVTEDVPAPVKPPAANEAADFDEVLWHDAEGEDLNVVPPAPQAAPKLEAKPVVKPVPVEVPMMEMSDEPDFGLGIGDILRSDVGLKAGTVREAREAVRRSDAEKLSIDSILRGSADAKALGADADEQDVDAEQEQAEQDDDMAYMDPVASDSGRSAIKTAMLVVLALALFAFAAGGVYVFISKYGMPSFGSRIGKPDTVNVAVPPVNEVPAPPSSATVTVLVGAAAPATPGAKPFVVSRTVETEEKATGSFTATGKASSAAGKSAGRATILNTTARPYTFVATTRLLSKEGVLFRMKTTTAIPANGSVTVDVQADQPGASGDIGPTSFTIPGLTADLQKLITAKSDAAMTGGAGTAVGVSQDDINKAKAELTEKLRKEAMDSFAVLLTDGEKAEADMVTSTELAVTAPKVGTPGTTFSLTLSVRFKALLLPEKAITPFLDDALAASLPESASAMDYSLGSAHYAIQAYDTTTGVAEVRAEAPIIRR